MRAVGQAMSRQKILDKMELLENPDEESTDRLSLRFPDPAPLRISLLAELQVKHFPNGKEMCSSHLVQHILQLQA